MDEEFGASQYWLWFMKGILYESIHDIGWAGRDGVSGRALAGQIPNHGFEREVRTFQVGRLQKGDRRDLG
jgi:hypothetical protein